MQGMERHLNYMYPLPKMDQIGIPNFYWGAMENWGLVTYRESALYYDPATSPMSQMENVAGIVAHEYAHQWFGNIISPKWWEFIWLNEGFATLFEYIGVDLVYPDWRVIDLMVVLTCQPVLVRDSYETTRPMNYYVEDPASVQNIFDFVAYSKCKICLEKLFYN
jgi:aminopeptidase N